MANAETSPDASGPRGSPTEPSSSRAAWQPFTPRGVAAFAFAKIGRLFTVQLFVAATAVGTVCWFLSHSWFPVVKSAIRQLPETGGITNGVLLTPLTTTEPLAQNRFLAFVADPDGKTGAEVPTDFLVTFRRNDVRICSLFGCAVVPYEKSWRIPFSRVDLDAAFGAWRSSLFVVASLGTIAGLFASWILLAALATPVVRLYAFFKDRHVTLLGSWKLSAAALLPGALVATALIALYGLGIIDLVRFLIGWSLHFLVSVIYLVLSPPRLPPVPEATGAPKNPFAPPNTPSDETSESTS